MSVSSATRPASERPEPDPSACHPVDPGTPVKLPPGPEGGNLRQTLKFVANPHAWPIENHERFGEVWQMKLMSRADAFLATSNPEHIKAMFTAAPEDAPSLTGESPLRPIVGPYSVLTLVGPEHMRQRKLLLPSFHGDAVARYVQMIEEITREEIDRWEPGQTFALAPRMQAVTLEVIMRGVLGIEEPGSWMTPQRRFREAIRFFLNASNNAVYQASELLNSRRTEPLGLNKLFTSLVDRELYAVIRDRRAQGHVESKHDVFSLLLAATDEEGNAMTDQELRDELVTLILAGHETTANSLAWTFERLVRTPDAYMKLKDRVRTGTEDQADAYVEATIHEGMRVRPVINFVVRGVRKPWRFGEYVVPERTPIALSITGVQHRADIYPEPFRFNPDRFLDQGGNFVKPGNYTWIPFGGGIRRCLGATLAMAEQRVVLKEIARRVDFATTDAPAERARQRNVTSIPADGGKVTVLSRT